LTIDTENATRSTRLLLNGQALETTFLSPSRLRARLPVDLTTASGTGTVQLSNGFGRSNMLRLVIRTTGPEVAGTATAAPVLRRLGTSRIRLGETFNAQADGQSALWVETENAVPETVIYFDGTPLQTAYGGEHSLTAVVPEALLSTPGTSEVYLRYPGGESNRLVFTVQP
jgi:hypothetical protein